jgi:hypothetical protein
MLSGYKATGRGDLKMQDAENARTSGQDYEKIKQEYEKVKLLFDYTKMHIQIYISLGTILVGVFGFHRHFDFCEWILGASIFGIGVAGLAGGIIASTLPECSSLQEFFDKPIGIWEGKWFFGRTWTRIEHTAFWFGLIVGLLSFLVPQLPTALRNAIFCPSHTSASAVPGTPGQGQKTPEAQKS